MCHAAFSDLTPAQVAVRSDTIRRLITSNRHTSTHGLLWSILEPLPLEVVNLILSYHHITPETPE